MDFIEKNKDYLLIINLYLMSKYVKDATNGFELNIERFKYHLSEVNNFFKNYNGDSNWYLIFEPLITNKRYIEMSYIIDLYIKILFRKI